MLLLKTKQLMAAHAGHRQKAKLKNKTIWYPYQSVRSHYEKQVFQSLKHPAPELQKAHTAYLTGV
jgi:hypothetical protein